METFTGNKIVKRFAKGAAQIKREEDVNEV